jgi:hypothetical protein
MAALIMCVGLIFYHGGYRYAKVDDIPFRQRDLSVHSFYFCHVLGFHSPQPIYRRLFQQTNMPTADMIFSTLPCFLSRPCHVGVGGGYTTAVFGQQHPYAVFVLTLNPFVRITVYGVI